MHNIPINKHPAQNSTLPDATVFDIHIGDLPFQDSSLPNPVIRSTFHEWAMAQDLSTFLATDGSKTDTNVTSAFTDYSNSIKAHYTLHPEATIFTAEGFAILCALQHATENNSNITVCTDSQAILTAINAYQDKSSSIIYTIINHINSRNKDNLRTRLVWTPAHKGITINEQADKLAKSLPNDTKKTRYITPEDYISIINTDIKKQMDTDWHNFPSHSDYHWFTIGRHIPVMDYTDRYTTILIHRARTNSLITNSFLHKRNLMNTDRCRFCPTEQDTTRHRLDKCYHFDPVRKKFLTTIISDVTISSR
ncbi:uncharacterized protein [Centruroides vittatus]|uniref:uncharacterized protein n=1 Tax=Centruroides vittatus TaxID=120091 RepID=UPI00350F43F9